MVTAVERSALTDATGGLHGFPAALTSFVGRAAARRVVELQAPWSVDEQWHSR